jgi:hypothetical protein
MVGTKATRSPAVRHDMTARRRAGSVRAIRGGMAASSLSFGKAARKAIAFSGEVGTGSGARSAKVGAGFACERAPMHEKRRAFRAANRYPLSLKAR